MGRGILVKGCGALWQKTSLRGLVESRDVGDTTPRYNRARQLDHSGFSRTEILHQCRLCFLLLYYTLNKRSRYTAAPAITHNSDLQMTTSTSVQFFQQRSCRSLTSPSLHFTVISLLIRVTCSWSLSVSRPLFYTGLNPPQKQVSCITMSHRNSAMPAFSFT